MDPTSDSMEDTTSAPKTRIVSSNTDLAQAINTIVATQQHQQLLLQQLAEKISAIQLGTTNAAASTTLLPTPPITTQAITTHGNPNPIYHSALPPRTQQWRIPFGTLSTTVTFSPNPTCLPAFPGWGRCNWTDNPGNWPATEDGSDKLQKQFWMSSFTNQSCWNLGRLGGERDGCRRGSL